MASDNGTFFWLGKEYNCSSEDVVDPDVAGIGVMTAFWVTGVLTFICIHVGYFKNKISTEQNRADLLIKTFMLLPWYLLRRKQLRPERLIAPPSKETEQGFASLFITFSDQQLITGLAMLVAVFCKGDITVYTLQLAVAVSWFSATIHLSTLVVLRGFMREHPRGRKVRLLVMAAIIGLLLAAKVISDTVGPPSVDISTAGTTATVVQSSIQPSDAAFCAYQKGGEATAVDIFSIAWLSYALLSRIFQVFVQLSVPSQERGPAGGNSRGPAGRIGFFEFLRGRIDRNNRPLSLLQACQTLRGRHDGRNSGLNVHRALALAYLEFVESVAFELCWVNFSFVYGMVLSMQAWSICGKIDELTDLNCLDPALKMGFGQIVPLVLLLLSVLGFLQYYDEREKPSTPEAPSTAPRSPDEAEAETETLKDRRIADLSILFIFIAYFATLLQLPGTGFLPLLAWIAICEILRISAELFYCWRIYSRVRRGRNSSLDDGQHQRPETHPSPSALRPKEMSMTVRSNPEKQDGTGQRDPYSARYEPW